MTGRRPGGPASVGQRESVVGERGSVTAEFAVLLPALVLMLAVLMGAATAAAAQLRCVDAARSGARLAARHESAAAVVSAARAVGPPGSAVRVSSVGDLVRVSVGAQVSLPLPGRPHLGVKAASVARSEDRATGF